MALLAGFLAASTPLVAQPCRPPRDLLVCQDLYGPTGRVFLLWRNGETTYTAVRIFADGALAGEGNGSSTAGFISNLAPGAHTFSVEGVCGDMSSERASRDFTVLSATPHTKPIESMECSFDPATRILTAVLVPSATPSLFIDVFIRRAGIQGKIFVKTVPGDATTIQVPDALQTDRLILQFFDEDCHGSELIACPGPSCLPVLDLRPHQDIYGGRPRVFLLWLPNAVEYTAFDIFVDQVKVGQASGTSGLYYIDDIDGGTHDFGVRGICNGESVGIVTTSFEVLATSPHDDPASNLRCRHDRDEKTITATWLLGQEESVFIDVYLRHRGVSRLEFLGTIDGRRTRVQVSGAADDDQLVLQFFDTKGYGSPLMTCTERGSGDFIRGDANGSSRVELTDAIFTLNFLFLGHIGPLCPDSADANDDGHVDVSDPVFILNWLFLGAIDPPDPGGEACGPDPTKDSLAWCLTAACE
jgi:hypothetical protein